MPTRCGNSPGCIPTTNGRNNGVNQVFDRFQGAAVRLNRRFQVSERFHTDGLLKDMFQHDRPTLLKRLAGGLAVREYLNVEFPKLIERRLDLVLLLADGSILHIEVQGANDRDMPYREGVYCFLLGQKYRRRKIRQVVLYVGRPKMNMPAGVDLGDTAGAYSLIDMREFDVDALLASPRPADYALAILARNGEARVAEIVRRIVRLKGPVRERALAQLLVLSGLRGLPRRVQWEIERMSVVLDIRKNPVLMKWRREAITEGLAEGRAKGLAEGLAEGIAKGKSEGKAEGKAESLRSLLILKFGVLPKWADQRIAAARITDLDRWLKKVLAAETLDGVIGPRR